MGLFDFLRRKPSGEPAAPVVPATAPDAPPVQSSPPAAPNTAPNAAREASNRHKAQGNALFGEGRFEQALACFEQAVQADPTNAAAWFNRALAQRELRAEQAACDAFAEAFRLDPSMADASHLLGNLRAGMGQVSGAIAAYRAAVAADPLLAGARFDLGIALIYQGQLAEAAELARTGLALQPDAAELHGLQGAVHLRGGELDAALASWRRAVALDGGQPDLHAGEAGVLIALGRDADAAQAAGRALALDAQHAEALVQRAVALDRLAVGADAARASSATAAGVATDAAADAHAEAEVAARAAAEARLALSGVLDGREYLLGRLIDTRIRVCDWAGRHLLLALAEKAVREGRRAVHPFTWLGVCGSGELQRMANDIFAAHQYPEPASPPSAVPAGAGGDAASASAASAPPRRLRIAYLSADLHNHATAQLMAAFFEAHDRARFETFALSFGPDRRDAMRDRLRLAFDHFIDVGPLADAQVARRMAELGIDIAVDLKGYTADARPGIVAARGAPVQVSWIGYPATTGMTQLDYILADRRTVPAGYERFYSEQVVCLPDTYQPNDPKRLIGTQVPTRAECGLPDAGPGDLRSRGFVFCCFNNNYKITPELFDVWMRLLQAVPRSVLWLLQDNALAAVNLRREAAARGVDPARLAFAPRAPLEQHLARHAHADLFLDTLPCNAHTTASDALWAGLPVLTCTGEAFASRVAASLLHAVGLPQLVTHSLADYEALALRLANAPDELAALRRHLRDVHDSAPLFDPVRLCRHVESAFETMHARRLRGDGPASFDVSPLASLSGPLAK